jgi:hypothetical protein
VLGSSRASVPQDAEARLALPWIAGLLLRPQMKYVENHFSMRIRRRDGTSKLLLGVTGRPPQIDSIKQIKLSKDEVLKVKMVDHPRRSEPAEAIEV